MSRSRSSAGDTIPTECRVIEVRVAELRQLFNAIDPSPFRERDLDPRAEEFIVGWARDVPRDARLALLVHLDRSAGQADEAPLLGESVHEYFKQRALESRRGLRELFRRGRISLVIALAFLGTSIAVGDALASFLRDTQFAEIIREGLLIVGWVAMWRPLEVFLYDWWPIRAEALLFDRLSDDARKDRVPGDHVNRRVAGRLAGRVRRRSRDRHRRESIATVEWSGGAQWRPQRLGQLAIPLLPQITELRNLVRTLGGAVPRLADIFREIVETGVRKIAERRRVHVD